MKHMLRSVIAGLIVLSFFEIPAYGEVAAGPLPRNISIEVEFKEAGLAGYKKEGNVPLAISEEKRI